MVRRGGRGWRGRKDECKAEEGEEKGETKGGRGRGNEERIENWRIMRKHVLLA